VKNSPEAPLSRGAVLVVVLLLLALVVALTVQSQFAARMRLARGRRALHEAQLREAAADAVHTGLRLLAESEGSAVAHPPEAWLPPLRRLLPSGIRTSCSIVDQNRYFDLNNLACARDERQASLSAAIVRRILVLCGAPRPAAQVAALRTRTARYGPLCSWHDLVSVDGFSRDVWTSRADAGRMPGAPETRLADCLALGATTGVRPVPVNIDTACRTVLVALSGLAHAQAVERLLARRTVTPLRSTREFLGLLDKSQAAALAPYVCVNSTVFAVRASASRAGITRRACALATRREAGPVEVVRWIRD